MILWSVAHAAIFVCSHMCLQLDDWFGILIHWLSLFVGKEENQGNPVQSETHTVLSQQVENTGNIWPGY